MKYKIHIPLLILLFNCLYHSYSQNAVKQDRTDLKISLNKTLDYNQNYFDGRETNIFLYPLKEKHPKYYEFLLEKLKGIPNSDSLYVVSTSFQNEKLFYDLFKRGLITSESDLKRASYYLKDSSSLSKKDYKHILNVLSFFENGKHKIIIDSDNDYDFSNNEVFIYNKKLLFQNNRSPNKEITDTIPLVDINYQLSSKEHIFNLKRKAQIFPYPNYFYSQIYKSESMKKHGLFLRIRDAWQGKISVDGEYYSVLAQGISNKSIEYLIKHDSLKNYKSNTAFDTNFKYKTADTILISKELYKIGKLNLDTFEFTLEKINSQKKIPLGNKMGFVLHNYVFQDLEGKAFSVDDYNNKKYTLLYFWGTWCAPCKELLPDLKIMNKLNRHKLNVIGISYRDKDETVKDYITNEKLNWPNTNFSKKTGIIKDLNILSYPTYILLNNKRKIIYEGSGVDGFRSIEWLLK